MAEVLIDTDLAGAMADTATAVEEVLRRELPEPKGAGGEAP